MIYRITVRGEGIELRGFVDDESVSLNDLAKNMHPHLVIASSMAEGPADSEQERELHHFETEQIIERLRAARANHPECEVHPEGDVVKCGWKGVVLDMDNILKDA